MLLGTMVGLGASMEDERKEVRKGIERAQVIIPSLDRRAVLEYLKNSPGAVNETVLLKRFCADTESDTGLSEGISVDLYKKHFILYHHLYRLAQELEGSPWYLHIRLVNIALIRRPEKGFCQFFDEDRGFFCPAEAGKGKNYCPRHEEEMQSLGREGILGAVSMASYYLNTENYRSMDAGKLDRMTRGVFYYAANQEEIERARRVMGLSADFTKERIRRRYLYLSKQTHPDRLEGERGSFQDLQEAYQILLEVASSRQ